MATITTISAGAKVRANYIPGVTDKSHDQNYTGQTVTVLEVRHGYTFMGRAGTDEQGTVCFANFTAPDGTIRNYYFSEWEMLEEQTTDKPSLPSPGSYIIIRSVTGSSRERIDCMDGKIAVVTAAYEARTAYFWDDETDRAVWKLGPVVMVGGVQDQHPNAIVTVTAWEAVPADYEPDEAAILRKQYVELAESKQSVESAFATSIEVIGTALRTEADRRGWCDDYDQIVDDINGDLPGPHYLAVRQREVEVRVTRTRTVTESTTVTITMTRDDDLSDYHDEIVELADSSYDWSEDDEETDNYEYEEA